MSQELIIKTLIDCSVNQIVKAARAGDDTAIDELANQLKDDILMNINDKEV